jgi:hypothetical protein
MAKFKDIYLTALILLLGLIIAECVPTSLLEESKEKSLASEKAKRTQPSESINDKKSIEKYQLSNSESKQKRGVNDQLYNDVDLASSLFPSGLWSDLDTSLYYPESAYDSDYLKGANYDSNRQSLFSNPGSPYYSEPLALPVEFSRLYGERKKRAAWKKNNRNYRLKRDTKLSPAEILTLLELAEANERNRLTLQPSYADYLNAPSLVSLANYPSYPSLQKQPLDDLGAFYETDNGNDDGEWMNTWTEPSVKYFPEMTRFDMMDKNNNMLAKRFMVSKKAPSPHFYRSRIAALSNNEPFQYYFDSNSKYNHKQF